MEVFSLLEEKLRGCRAGQSGLLALDWHNGVRFPLMDYDLSGLILGMDLSTKPEEIYLALLEATAFGTRMILEALEAAGIGITSILLSGGIPAKNRMLVQIYANVLNRRICVAESQNACARGAAILGVAAAKAGEYGGQDFKEIVGNLGQPGERIYFPDPGEKAVYHALYQEYQRLYAYFGTGRNPVMKKLRSFKYGTGTEIEDFTPEKGSSTP